MLQENEKLAARMALVNAANAVSACCLCHSLSVFDDVWHLTMIMYTSPLACSLMYLSIWDIYVRNFDIWSFLRAYSIDTRNQNQFLIGSLVQLNVEPENDFALLVARVNIQYRNHNVCSVTQLNVQECAFCFYSIHKYWNSNASYITQISYRHQFFTNYEQRQPTDSPRMPYWF